MTLAASGFETPRSQGRLSADRAKEIARDMMTALERPAICRLLAVEVGADFRRIDDRALTARLAAALVSGSVAAPDADARGPLVCWMTLSDESGGRVLLSSRRTFVGFERWPANPPERVEALLDDLLAQARARALVAAFLAGSHGGRRTWNGLTSEPGFKAACLEALGTDRLRVFKRMRSAGAEAAPRAAGKSEDGQKPLPRTSDPSGPVDHWIEIVLVGEDGRPLKSEPYELTMPDGALRKGTLDDDGRARLTGLKQAGSCKVAFPKIDAREWRLS